MEKKRPTGIVIISILDVLIGSFIFLEPLVATIFEFCKGSFEYSEYLLPNLFVLFLIVIAAILLIWIGISTWKLKPFSRIANICVYIILFLISIPYWFAKDLLLSGESFIFCLYCAGVIFYFTRPKIKEQFK